MAHAIKLLPIVLIFSLSSINAHAQQRLTVSKAIAQIATGQGEDWEAAETLLLSTNDLLPRNANALAGVLKANISDPDVLARVFELVASKDEEGCKFAAKQMNSLPWADLVLARLGELKGCAELDKAISGMLSWIPGSEEGPIAENRVLKILDLVSQREDIDCTEGICRFVGQGVDAVRVKAIETLVKAKTPEASTCLTHAYSKETALDNSQFRTRLLDAIAAIAGLDWVPTMLSALDRPLDYDVACGHLLDGGAINAMIFAVRTTDAPSAGIQKCFAKSGATGANLALSLIDHPSAAVRDFAANQIVAFPTQESADVMRGRFEKPHGKFGRSDALIVMAQFPPEMGGDIVEAALGDSDLGIRVVALRMIQKLHLRNFIAPILRVAEEDPEPEIRQTALQTLLRLGAVDAVPLASRMVQYEEPAVAAKAALLLGWLGDSKAFDILLKKRNDKNDEVAWAVNSALWLQSYTDPAKKKLKRKVLPKVDKLAKSTDVSCGEVTAQVLGKKGPLVMVLPGGPAMDHSWSRPYLDSLRKNALVAFVDTKDLPRPQDLDCLFTELGREKATLVSNGLGGTNALWIAAKNPGRFNAVVAISSPLPDNLESFVSWGINQMPQELADLASELLKERDLYHPDILNTYLSRVMAPVMAGSLGDAPATLPIVVNIAAIDKTAQELENASFDPAKMAGAVTFMLPVDEFAQAETYKALAAANPEKVAIHDVSGCGFQPQVNCSKKVVKAIVKVAEDADKR